MKKKACFICEASRELGVGHVMRCLSIAEELTNRGWDSVFIGQKQTFDFVPRLREFAFIEMQRHFENPMRCDLVVVDRYDIAVTRDAPLVAYAKKIMVIDDLANRNQECDILIDAGIGRIEEDYLGIVPPSCRILAGSGYAMVRKDIRDLVSIALRKREEVAEIKHVLINFGGGEQERFVLSVLEVLKNTAFKGKISVVLGFVQASPEFFSEIYNMFDSNMLCIYNFTSMSDRILEADLAVGAPASSFFERCALGLPSILYCTASNQKHMALSIKKLGRIGACVVDDLELSLKNAIDECLKSNYSELSNSAALFCDANGVERIVKIIDEVVL